jgi:hypothetical protein
MSELHEPIADLPRMLLLPAERDLPLPVREKQRTMLMAQITDERSSAAPSLVGHLLARARAFAVRFGLLVVLVAACLLSGFSATGNEHATRALEITAVASSATVLALSAARVERSRPDVTSSIRFHLSEIRRLDAQPNF